MSAASRLCMFALGVLATGPAWADEPPIQILVPEYYVHISAYLGDRSRNLNSEIINYLNRKATDISNQPIGPFTSQYPFSSANELVRRSQDFTEVTSSVSSLAFAPDSLLDDLDDTNGLHPFDHPANIDPAYRRLADDGRRNVWSAIGWIAFDAIEVKYDGAGSCRPDGKWNSCLENLGGNAFTLKIRPGFKGWPFDAVGQLSSARSNRDEDYATGNAALRVMTRDGWSTIAADFFLSVPDNETRAQRKVTVELWKRGDEKPIATSTMLTPISTADRPASGSTERNVCGGKNNACPMFNIPEEDWQRVVQPAMSLSPQ